MSKPATKSRTSSGRLPLFPDLLDQNDHFQRQRRYERNGHGIWGIGPAVHRALGEDRSEIRQLVVEYTDERFYLEKTYLRWRVAIRHYLHYPEVVERGWGASRTSQTKRKMKYRETERAFASRGEAVDFAERLLAAFHRVRAAKERQS